MELKQLEFFVAASECGSLSRAAARLYTTQPNVSKVIAALESELGQRLFERTSRGLRLTEYGKSIYQYADNILKNAELITHLERRRITPHFSVSTYSSHMMSSMLVRLYQNHPNLTIEHRQGTVDEVTDHVEQSISEIGVLYVSQMQLKPFRHIISHKRLEFVELGRRRAGVYVGQNHPLYEKDSVTQQELQQLQFVHALRDYFEVEHNFQSVSVGALRDEGFSAAVVTNSEHLTNDLIRRTSLATLGISLDDPSDQQQGIKHLWIEGEEAELVLGYVIQEKHVLSQYAQELTQQIDEALVRDQLVKQALMASGARPET